MGRRFYTSGLSPADIVPTSTPGLDARLPDTALQRLSNIFVPKPTRADRVYAALHLHDRSLPDVAELLGLGDEYEAVAAVKGDP